MKKLAYLILALIVLAPTAYALENNATRTINARNFIKYSYDKEVSRTLGYDSDALTFTMDKDQGLAIFNHPTNNLILNNFPISDRDLGTIELTRVRTVVDQNTKFLKKTKNGLVPFEAPKIYSYKGKIRGSKESFVMLNYSDGKIFGTIKQESGQQFNIAPFNDAISENNNLTHAVLPALNKDTDIPFACYTEESFDMDGSDEGINHKKHLTQGTSSDLIMVNLAAEGDWSFYHLWNDNANNAAVYIVSVMSMASIIYEDNINVRLYVSYVIINSDPDLDPYIGDDDISEKLDNMRDHWQNEYYDIPRASAVLFADLRLQQTAVAGIAYAGNYYSGVLCREDMGYAALGIKKDHNYPSFNYTWDVNVAAHELGHNFSSPHTHNCFWRDEWGTHVIDTCIKVYDACYADVQSVPRRPRPGTIMSYCHLTNSTRNVQLYFHDLVKRKIRTHVEDVASRKIWSDSCVYVPIERELYLLSPLGEKSTLIGGQETLIRWTFQNLTKIDIFFSDDNGNNWDVIAENIPAADSTYKWLVPSIAIDKGMIMIKDVDDPDVSDITLIPFKTSSASVNITSDFKYRRIGQLATIEVAWSAAYVDEFNVYLSVDNGSNWDMVVEGTKSKKADIDVPDIESENCFIKVTSAINDVVYSLSDKFAIGPEWAQLTWPAENDTICNDVPSDYEFPLKWEYDFMEKIFIYWRVDENSTWKKINFVAIEALDMELGWKPPSNVTNDAQIRIAPVDAKDMEDFTSYTFRLVACANSVEYVNYGEGLVSIEGITPNPASSAANITFGINEVSETRAEIFIIDEAGNYVKHIGVFESLSIGETSIDFETKAIAQGNYFIIVQTNNAQIASPFKVIK